MLKPDDIADIEFTKGAMSFTLPKERLANNDPIN